MRFRAFTLSAVLAASIAAGGCAAAPSAVPAPRASTTAPRPATPAARASTPFDGPTPVDPACAAALKAMTTLQQRQGQDQGSESALDQDFTNFANALNAAAAQAKSPATAKAMTNLASDYTNLVASQSGTAQLPDMATVQSDGTAFSKACP